MVKIVVEDKVKDIKTHSKHIKKDAKPKATIDDLEERKEMEKVKKPLIFGVFNKKTNTFFYITI